MLSALVLWGVRPGPLLMTEQPDIFWGLVASMYIANVVLSGLNQGPWHVTGNSQYVLMGGEFRRANGVGQQGLVRYAVPSIAPNDQGPVLTGAKIDLTVGSYQTGTARIRWTANHDRDNENLTYTLIRNSNQVSPVFEEVQASTFWERPAMGFIDRGLTPGVEYRYRLKVTDPFGNFVWSDTQYVTITADTGSSSEYVDDVLALDPSYYWRLGEPGGTKAIDWAGWSDANVGAGVTRGAAGAILGDADTATFFNGSPESIAVSPMSEQPSDTFTVETWINTTSTSGGKILGFGNNPTGNSNSYDRQVYMDAAGRVNFGVYTGSTKVLQSAKPYNDTQWHHVVASMGSNGMELFLDGVRVGVPLQDAHTGRDGPRAGVLEQQPRAAADGDVGKVQHGRAEAASHGKVTNESPAGAAFGPKRRSANTQWSAPTSTTLLQRVP